MAHFNAPAEVEALLRHFKDVKARYPESPYPPNLERVPGKGLPQVDYSRYVHSGEHNYAVARLMLELRVADYGLYCGQQAIENYLKAFIRANGAEPRMIHSLPELLTDCRSASTASPFIASDYAATIAERFDPFNEVARYPVQRTRPAGASWVSYYPEDVHILDYFVFRMRELVPFPPDHASLFATGTPRLMSFERTHPEIYALIRQRNINFPQPRSRERSGA